MALYFSQRQRTADIHLKDTSRRKQAISNDEKQIEATEQYDDREMRKVETQGVEILSSVAPGSNLDRTIHNPVTEGINEG